ncbi:MAG: hypothetical protein P8009_04615 [Gammaproteobacteria bacterium]
MTGTSSLADVRITSENKCSFCPGTICCTYITQAIDTPRSREDFDHLLWQLAHRNMQAYKDEDARRSAATTATIIVNSMPAPNRASSYSSTATTACRPIAASGSRIGRKDINKLAVISLQLAERAALRAGRRSLASAISGMLVFFFLPTANCQLPTANCQLTTPG